MRKTKSPILEAVHDTARGLHEAGVMDRTTMREFDRLCLPPVAPLAPEQIKQIREAARVSQAVFARLLNTSLSTVQKWEIGQKRPTGNILHERRDPACRGTSSRWKGCAQHGRDVMG